MSKFHPSSWQEDQTAGLAPFTLTKAASASFSIAVLRRPVVSQSSRTWP